MVKLMRQDPDSVSSVLSELFRLAALTRETAAATLSVSVSTVNNWCIGRSTMRLHQFAKLVSMASASGASRATVQTLVYRLLNAHGLSKEAGLKLMPPARILSQDIVLFVAPQALSRGNRMAIVGVRQYLTQTGVDVLVASAYGSSPVMDHSLADLIMAVDFRGVLVSKMMDEASVQTIADAAFQKGTPLIGVFNDYGLDRQATGIVEIDDHDIGRKAANFLLEHGHTKMAFFSTIGINRVYQMRFEGFRNAIREANAQLPDENIFWVQRVADLPPDAGLFEEQSHLACAKRIAGQLLEGTIDGVFCGSERATDALAQVLEAAGPRAELFLNNSMVGLATSRWPDTTKGPRFPYIFVPAYEIGRQAAKLVVVALKEDVAPGVVYRVEIPCDLVLPA